MLASPCVPMWACAQSLQSCLTLCDAMDHQAPLSMGFSSQEYWEGLPCPPPGDLPNSGTKTTSPALWADLPLLSQQGSSLPPNLSPDQAQSLAHLLSRLDKYPHLSPPLTPNFISCSWVWGQGRNDRKFLLSHEMLKEHVPSTSLSIF